MSTRKPKKSSTRSKVDPYTVLTNWLPGGSCRFWDNEMHAREMYEASLNEAIKGERGIVVLQQNVGKNHSIR